MRRPFLLRCTPPTHSRPVIVLRDPGLGVSPHEAARVHHNARRCGSNLAARSARAAAGKAADYRVLGRGTASTGGQWAAAFVQRLRELGWIENRTVAIEYRWGEGRDERFAEIAAEFIRLKVDVILTYGTPSAIAAKKATAVIPIVSVAGDPVGTGLVASLAKPGGNVTGLSVQQPDLASKRLELLREVLPDLRTVAILVDIGSPNSVLEMREAQA